MTFEEYAALEGLNFSTLKAGRRSAKHLKHAMANQREDTIRLGLGRAAHCCALTPDLFPVEFAVWRGGDRRGQQWNEFKAANQDRTIIKVDEYADCIGMRDSLLAHPVAGKLLAEPGEREKVITWTDPETEVLLKARIDGLCSVLFDLKTAADVDARHFGALAHRYGYHVQMALYHMGLKANGIERPVKIIAVETAAPWDVAVFPLSEDDLWAGEDEARELLRMVAAGLHSGKWPGRYEEEVPLELPAYAFPDTDDVAGLLVGEEAA